MDSEVSALEAGPVREVLVHEGQEVRAGTVMVRIDDQDALLELERARLGLENARAQAASDSQLRSSQQVLKLAELELQRRKTAGQAIGRFSK